MKITQEHLKYVKDLGYKVKSNQEINLRGLSRTFFVGKCPRGHNIKSEVRKSMQEPKCKQCYYESMKKTDENIKILEKLGYDVSSYVKRIPSGRNKIFIKGYCPNKHELDTGLLKFMPFPHCKKCEGYSKGTLKEHLVLLQTLGYKVEIVRVPLDISGYRSTIVGSCPMGHKITNLSKPVPNPRCNECYLGKIREDNLSIAIQENYKVKIVIREQSGQSSRTYFTGKCPNGHNFDMKVVTFISGKQRCSPCNKKLIAKGIEKIIADTKYNLNVKRVQVKNKDRDTRLYVVGSCPEGHKISMNAISFRNGARCRACNKYGFSMGRPAVFYLISGEKIRINKDKKANMGIIEESILKYGVFHPGSGRLLIHASRGFNPTPLFSLYHKEAEVIAELEKRVGIFLEDNKIKTCKDIGLSFDGATESIFAKNIEVKILIANIKSIAKQLEIEYKSKFKKITAIDTLTIGDRSRSVNTKEALLEVISRIEDKENKKTRIKSPAKLKGASHA